MTKKNTLYDEMNNENFMIQCFLFILSSFRLFPHSRGDALLKILLISSPDFCILCHPAPLPDLDFVGAKASIGFDHASRCHAGHLEKAARRLIRPLDQTTKTCRLEAGT